MVRVFWGKRNSIEPPFYLNLTSFLPQFHLFLTSFLPLSNLSLTSASSRISNHGLEKPRFTDSRLKTGERPCLGHLSHILLQCAAGISSVVTGKHRTGPTCRGPEKIALRWAKIGLWLFFCYLPASFGAFFRNVPVTPTPSVFPKVLPYKWGAYCRTNGRRTAVQMGGVLQGFPFLRSLEARKVRRYKRGAYCRTNWRCTAVLFGQAVGVGVSETLPIFECGGSPPSLRGWIIRNQLFHGVP